MKIAKLSPVRLLVIGFVVLGLSACSLMPPDDFPRARHVDIQRFMGPWYVIANIPPIKTADAYDALECYTLASPGEIATVFTFRDGDFDSQLESMKPTGYVIDGTGNAVWGMSFFWPIKLQFIITYVSDDYQTTVIARSKRDYVWIMARTPTIPEATYNSLVKRVAALGYDMSKLRKIPQQPLEARDDGCS